MSKTIFKFPINTLAESQNILMPRGGIIRSAQYQSGILCLWAEVDRLAPMEDRFIEIFGTGHAIPEADRTFIGTVQQGSLVWHIYELHHLTPSE